MGCEHASELTCGVKAQSLAECNHSWMCESCASQVRVAIASAAHDEVRVRCESGASRNCEAAHDDMFDGAGGPLPPPNFIISCACLLHERQRGALNHFSKKQLSAPAPPNFIIVSFLLSLALVCIPT